jgi:hypothetical protein
MRCTVHCRSTHGASQCMRQWLTCALACIWCGPWQSAERLLTGIPTHAVSTAANKQDAQAASGCFTGNACKAFSYMHTRPFRQSTTRSIRYRLHRSFLQCGCCGSVPDCVCDVWHVAAVIPRLRPCQDFSSGACRACIVCCAECSMSPQCVACLSSEIVLATSSLRPPAVAAARR